MTELDAKIQELHGTYCRLTRIDLPFNMSFWLRWEQFIKTGGYTKADLELVIRYIGAHIKKGERRVESFRFYNLVGDLERFAEDLSFARAAARPATQSPRETIRMAGPTGRPPEPPILDAKPVGKILSRLEIAEGFGEIRKKLESGEI